MRLCARRIFGVSGEKMACGWRKSQRNRRINASRGTAAYKRRISQSALNRRSRGIITLAAA